MIYQQPAAAPPPAAARLPGWGTQVSFFQRRQAAFWLFVVLLAFTTLTVLTEQLTYLEVFPAGWLFSIVLLALYVVPVALAIYVLDLFEREPISLLVAAFLWGGVVAVGLAGETNGAWLQILAKIAGVDVAQEWGAALVAPPVEETFKFIGLVAIYLIVRTEIDDLFDGFVYGAMIGLGFAAVENVQYFVQAIASAGGGDQIGPVFQMFLLRVIFVGLYMHVLWTGIAGLGLAYYVTQRDRSRGQRLAVGAGLFGLAVVAHVIWNSPLLVDLVGAGPVGQILYGLIKGSPFFIFVVLLVVLAQRREHRWFQVAIASDAGTDVLTPHEVADLGGLRSRWRSRRLIGERKGAAGRKLMGRLQREQINLAMIRTRVGSDDHPDMEAQRLRIRAIRAELQAMPDVGHPFIQQPAVTAGGPAIAPPAPPAGPPAPPATPPAPPAGPPAPPATPPAPPAGPPAPPAAPVAPPTHSATSAPPPAAADAPVPASTPVPAAAPATPAAAAPATAPPTSAAPETGAQPFQSPTWQPTHLVPAAGLPAWDVPDPGRPPVTLLPAGLELRVLEQYGAWGRVVAANGWSGWVDGRYLVPR